MMTTLLVPLDFSDVTQRVIEAAKLISIGFGSRIVLLHVAEPEPEFIGFEPGPVAMRASVAHDIRDEHRKLEAAREHLASFNFKVLALQVQGPIAAKILSEAAEQDAEMIILGSHGHGALYHLLVGSVTEGVLKDARCPVLVVPSEAGKKIKTQDGELI